ncbi:hypothetical protein CR205_10310 [Alteribacter lacisalsi]|uniref:Uncharacterized protein n=1 Tax=Alteribacter lacisalsi TaxID=2045244 RepID=A0A2W0HCM4_9BACI|nr:hypothetical protein [Alteribacter lacisalsi]PYZ98937.1 hypothetical protein CR205_10310 [Alteribacter lacisalsi]
MRMIWLLVPFLLVIIACSSEVGSEMNPDMLDEEVDFPYAIPELDDYLITAVDVAPRHGTAERVDLYYVHEEEVGRNRQLMEMEEGFEAEFDIRRVYGPYDDFSEFSLVMIQSPEPFHEPYKNEVEVDGQMFQYTISASGEKGMLTFQTAKDGIYLDVSIKQEEDHMPESEVIEKISRFYSEFADQFE